MNQSITNRKPKSYKLFRNWLKKLNLKKMFSLHSARGDYVSSDCKNILGKMTQSIELFPVIKVNDGKGETVYNIVFIQTAVKLLRIA